MGSRRIVVVGAVAAATVLAGVANASAAPSSDSGDRHAVEVQAHRAAKRMAVDPIPSEYTAIAPVRVLDTRNTGGPVGQGGSVSVDLSGLTPANATSVVLNVTGTAPTASTFVTVYPSDEGRPDASNLNLSPGQTRANQVTVALSADRRVTLFNNAGNTHLIADLSGYYQDGLAALYNPVTPGRVLDTRNSGGPVGAGGTVDVAFPWLPGSATAVTFNLTGVNATTNTFVTAYPAGSGVPLASNVNVGPGEAVPNQVTVPLGVNKTVRLLNGNGTVHLIADMVGYYDSSAGFPFVPVSPERAMDTRPGAGLTPDFFIALTGWGEESDPVALMGMVGNVTATNPSNPQFVVVYPGGAQMPNTSNLNLVTGQTAANAVSVGIGFENAVGDRSVNFANNAGYVDVIFDIAGFFVQFN
ncbi:hypothetical protein [Actinophytocola oryzae]|uniref:Uncharacterized protein n=1 Tax=Actinophytocola oryzae TaxID=502181 RepID=A0A4R7VY04_9PSEU|nr:hypothetical protein [Actinophytocola oryzae]TDV55046.1 hypothetical protein CLV71_103287 [Actinophytocola oryzae]